MYKTTLMIAVTALSALLTGCGGGGNLNQVYSATPMQANNYLYPAPTQIQTNGTAQALPGGRAVATATGYVYEQNAAANSPGYSYYNAQNACLYPVAGQTVNCGTTANGATAGYYTGQQPINTTLPQQASSSYGTGYAVPPAGAGGVAPSSYGTPAASSYGTPNAYATTPTAANPYATTPTAANPYATTPATTANPYGTTPAASNPYGTGTSAPSTYTGQSAPQTSAADRARSRIDTSSPVASGTGTTSTGKKGTSF